MTTDDPGVAGRAQLVRENLAHLAASLAEIARIAAMLEVLAAEIEHALKEVSPR